MNTFRLFNITFTKCKTVQNKYYESFSKKSYYVVSILEFNKLKIYIANCLGIYFYKYHKKITWTPEIYKLHSSLYSRSKFDIYLYRFKKIIEFNEFDLQSCKLTSIKEFKTFKKAKKYKDRCLVLF